MKKILSVSLILTLLLSTLCILPAGADELPEGVKSGDFWYNVLDDGTASIVSYEGSASHLVFPTEIDGYTITEIKNPFNQNKSIVSITVPEGIKHACLWGAENLEELILPDSLDEFFTHYIENTKLYKNPNNWEDGALYLGNRLLVVDNHKVSGVFKVKEGTKYISHQTFADNENITEVILPDSLVKIESGAFKGCTALSKVTFGESLEFIGEETFVDCTNLKNITLPEGITKLEYGTFRASGLEEIVFPFTLKFIENETFSGCCNLKSITIPPSVTHLGSAFSFCENLSEVKLPDTLEFIGSGAFHATAFANNPENYEDNLLYYGDYLLDYSDDFIGTCKVKESTRVVADRLFSHCDTVTSVIFPDGVMGIADSFFSKCKNLEYVKLPANMKKIHPYTFSGCTKLISINIPEGVTEICEGAFINCPALNYISIPASVENISTCSIGYVSDYDVPDGVSKAESTANLTIAGYEGTFAEKYAFENDLSFKKLSTAGEYKYKDKVLELFEGIKIHIYHEGYEYYSNPEENETTPDFVLITAYNELSADCSITQIFGNYVLHSPDLKYPGEEFGYHIYLPRTNKIYTLCEAFEMGIEGVYNVFTEGGLGELIGDVNYDNKLNIRDATMIQQHIAGYDNMNIQSVHGGYTETVADFNRDGKMNIRDATAIQKRLAGLDFEEIEYTVLGITRLSHPTDKHVSVKAVARSSEELMSILSKVTDNSGVILHDKQLDEEYFKEKNVIVIAEVLGGICGTKTFDSVKSNGTALKVQLTNHYSGVCLDEVIVECVLIEVDKADTDSVLEIEVRESTVLLCP